MIAAGKTGQHDIGFIAQRPQEDDQKQRLVLAIPIAAIKDLNRRSREMTAQPDLFSYIADIVLHIAHHGCDDLLRRSVLLTNGFQPRLCFRRYRQIAREEG